MNRKTALAKVYEGILSDDSILVGMRRGAGLDDERFETVVEAIEFLIQDLKESRTVPKQLALCFVDISNYFYFHEGKYSQAEMDRMEDAAHKLSELANQLFDS